MGEVNFIPAKIVAEQNNQVQLESVFGPISLSRSAFTAQPPLVGAQTTLCIRPEQLRPPTDTAERSPVCRAKVVSGAFFGTHFRCHLKLENAPEITLVAHLPQSTQVNEGDSVEVSISPVDVVAISD